MRWADEYRRGRADQVEQQRIANLIAISSSPLLPIESRHWAADQAIKALSDPVSHPTKGQES